MFRFMVNRYLQVSSIFTRSIILTLSFIVYGYLQATSVFTGLLKNQRQKKHSLTYYGRTAGRSKRTHLHLPCKRKGYFIGASACNGDEIKCCNISSVAESKNYNEHYHVNI